MITTLPLCALLALAQSAAEDPASDWTGWGGPGADFFVRDAPPLVEDWGEAGPKVLWKRELGEGYASILHRDGVLYTVYREEDVEIVVALDAATGETLWDQVEPAGRYPDMTPQFGEGPNSTPLILGERLVHSDIAGSLRCLDVATGEPLWTVDLHAEYGRGQRMEEYGYSGIHLDYEGKLIVLVGGDRHGVVALDPKDGSLVWGSEPFRISYAPPALLPIRGDVQLIVFSPTEVLGLDPDDGAVLWRHEVRCRTENNLTAPLLCAEDTLWISSQFEGGTRLLRLNQEEGGLVPEPVWFTQRVQQCHWNSILIGDQLYGSVGTVGGSRFSAVDWRTGEILWQNRDYHAAQCLYADGKILLLDEEGQLAILRVSPEGPEILATHVVGEPVCWSIPTLVGSTLYVRDTQHVMALDLAASAYEER